jgi:hypothetical protein
MPIVTKMPMPKTQPKISKMTKNNHVILLNPYLPGTARFRQGVNGSPASPLHPQLVVTGPGAREALHCCRGDLGESSRVTDRGCCWPDDMDDSRHGARLSAGCRYPVSRAAAVPTGVTWVPSRIRSVANAAEPTSKILVPNSPTNSWL